MSTASYDFLAVQNNPLQANTIPVGYPDHTPLPQPHPRDEFEAEIGNLEQDLVYLVPRRDEPVRDRVLAQSCGAQMAQMGRAWVKH